MAETKNEQIEKLRKDVAKLLDEPEFQEMSNALKHALAQRLGVHLMKEGGLTLEFSIPITINEIRRLGFGDGDPYNYVNVYSYTFH
jgi:hypothetical protein